MKNIATPQKSERPATSEMAAALYVNYFEMGHNPFEFLIDLGQFYPGSGDCDGKTVIHSRIALAPPYAKMLSELLVRMVDEHEANYGSIAEVAPSSELLETVFAPLGDFEARARALRAAPPSTGSFKHR